AAATQPIDRDTGSVRGRLCRHRTSDPGAAEAAISVRILREILLVVVLGEVERRGFADLSGDLAQPGGIEPALIGFSRRLCRAALRRREGVYRRAILGADIVALPHALGRVVALPEQFQERLIAGDFRVVNDEHGLGVPGASAADLLIGRVGGGTAGVADGGDPDPQRLPEYPLGPPEAAKPEHRLFQALGIGPDQGVAVDEMPVRYGHRFGSSRQALAQLGNDQFVTHKRPHLAPSSWNPMA